MKSIKHIILFTFLLAFAACQDDNNVPVNESSVQGEVNTFLENFGESTQARFIGTVVNEQNNPIAGVTVNIGSAFAATDSNGIFSITDATVYEKFAYVKASKSGFIEGSRALVPTDGINQVKIMLLDIEPIAVITSGQAITIDLPDGTEVDFSGDFETEFGTTYQGDVSVTVKHLSPDDESMSLQMPGSLIAENMDGDLRVLETLGMITVELRGENGEELNIASGTMATIRIPVASAITNPPATVPLWSFNEEFGYWQEDGIGTLEGANFVGVVTHFSFWNWDFQYPSVNVCITLQDANGNVLPNTALNLYSPALNSTGSYGYTNGSGEECGLVPQDDTLTLVVPNYGCIGNDFTTTIGPFSGDENITVTVADASALLTNFTATLNDCEGNAITNGYLQLFYNGATHTYPVSNGALDLSIDYCSTNTAYTAQVIDLSAGQSTTVFTGNFSTPTTAIGTQMSCVDLTDTDGDNVIDIDEDINGNNNLDDDDTDGDGIPDYQDEDDDGDGINTVDEDYDNDGNPMNEDTDGDGIPDYLDANDINLFGSEQWATNCDANNPEYDLTQHFEGGGNYPNLTFTYYETQLDADTNTNEIATPSMYVSLNTMAFAKGTSTITGQSAVVDIYLLGIENFTDSDQDGLTDCEELTGIDNGFGNCNPNGNITDPNNPDTDGDGFNDCVESNVGTDPNDLNSFPANTNPVAVNDDVTLSHSNLDLIDILSNDYDTNINGTIDINTIDLDPNTLGQQFNFTVSGEGSYSIITLGSATSAVNFDVEPGFIGAATPITYTVNDNEGNVSNEATISVTMTN